MNGLQPSHEIRKLTIVLPAPVVDALRSKLRGDETITDCIKRLVIREAMGSPEDQIPSLAVSREQQAHYQAELARLELLRLRGCLV